MIYEANEIELYDPLVHGLPVYLSKGQAQQWLREKRFSGRPAIVALAIPISALDGANKQVTIIETNTRMDIQDRALSFLDIQQRLKEGQEIGPCYLQGVNGEFVSGNMRVYEHIIARPVVVLGKIIGG